MPKPVPPRDEVARRSTARSVNLSARYGQGYSVRNVRLLRAFYLAWPIVQTSSAEWGEYLPPQGGKLSS